MKLPTLTTIRPMGSQILKKWSTSQTENISTKSNASYEKAKRTNIIEKKTYWYSLILSVLLVHRFLTGPSKRSEITSFVQAPEKDVR